MSDTYYTTEPGKYPDETPGNGEAFTGQGWSITRTGGKCLLTYISGALQGGLKTIEITEEDLRAAQAGKMSLDDFCIKYNVS